jgi:ABC-type transport system involved in multi-copper enzyme maturation permease subunit
VSAQTGRPAVPTAPPSSRRFERAKLGLTRLRNDPNPIWMRELRQAARLQRTPVILAVVTGMMTLLICSVGGVASVHIEPARVGVALFHTFFSLAFAVVTWIGPAVAASTIAAERGSRTWEALMLTGLGAPAIARGKFLASFTYVSLYIVMLAPVGALPFLFGGVTALEVVVAFALLFLLAALSVAFGLSVSSKFSSPAVAIIVTLVVAVPLSLAGYTALGPALSVAVHELWSVVPAGPPVWLPTAYARAELGLEYLALLVLAPLVAVVLPAWFFYEVTVANMASPSDDRSTGLRRWFLVSAPLVSVASLAPAIALGEADGVLIAIGVYFAFLVLCAFVFAGEPLGPSRRVELHWDRQGVGRWRRYLGPGILRASSLLLALGVLGLLAQIATGVLFALTQKPPSVADAHCIAATGGYLAAFVLFVVGFGAWARARSRSAAMPRLLLAGAVFLAAIGPWIVMAIAGVVSDDSDRAMLLASPSPTYVVVMLDAIARGGAEAELALAAGGFCAAFWGLIGLLLLSLAGSRTRRVIREHEAALARVEAMLRAEDEAVGNEAA